MFSALALGLLGAGRAVAQPVPQPVDMEPAAFVTPQEVTVTWTSTGNATTAVYYGPSSQPGFRQYPFMSGAGTPAGTSHSHTLRNLQPGTYYFRTASTSIFGVVSESAEGMFGVPPRNATTPLQSLAPDGPVWAVAVAGTKVYAGGRFTRVGPVVGGGVPTDTGQGNLAHEGFPMVAGAVYAVAPDGNGGFYIGGDFDRVGGLRRHNAAHLFQDMGVDPAWAPDVDGDVRALLVTSASVYLGGSFQTVNGAPRLHAAAVGTASGKTTLPWDPAPDKPLLALGWTQGGVLLGGSFTALKGAARSCLAQVDALTGAPTAWHPAVAGGPNGTVVSALALSPDNSVVYVGGEFTDITNSTLGNTVPRRNLAAFFVASGDVTPFNPQPDGRVEAIAVGQGRVFAGGRFTTLVSPVGGATVTRKCLAALDGTTGEPALWSPELDGPVHALAVTASTVYAGGDFMRAGGAPRERAAAWNTAAILQQWNPQLSGPVFALGHVATPRGDFVYVGGEFHLKGPGTPRLSAAAFDVSSSGSPQLLPWNPSVGGEVTSLLVDGQKVFIGGQFASVGTALRGNLALVDADSTGAPLGTLSVSVGGRVNALAKSGTMLFVGGSFSRLGSVPTDNLGLVELGTGSPSALPAPSGAVYALALGNQRLYVGGAFGSVGGAPRTNAAALDLNTAASPTLGSWSPATDNQVSTISATPNAVYLGGGFQTTGGLTPNIVAVDPVAGLRSTGWNHGTDGWVDATAMAGDVLYVGGGFRAADGVRARRAAAFDVVDLAVKPWAPDIEGYGSLETYVDAIHLDCTTGTLAFGGQFHGAQGLVTGPLALFRQPAGCSGRLPPSVTTLPAEAVTATTATFAAEVAPNATAAQVWMRYDTRDPGKCDDTFGTRVPAVGGLTVSATAGDVVRVTQDVQGLAPGTTYFHCALASSGALTGYGGLQPFSTPVDAVDAGVPGAPRITSAPPPLTAQCGVAWEVTGQATGDPVLKWSAPNPPEGLAVDGASGRATWTPNASQRGEVRVTLRVENGAGFDEETYPVEVTCPGEVQLGTGCQCGSAGDVWAVLSALGLLALRRRRSAPGAGPGHE